MPLLRSFSERLARCCAAGLGGLAALAARFGVSSSGDCASFVIGALERGEGFAAGVLAGGLTGLVCAEGEVLSDSGGGVTVLI